MRTGAVVLVLLAACYATGPQAAHPIRQIEAPEELRTRPLESGQWAAYEERAGGKIVGQALFSVEAPDACGTWVRVDLTPQGTTWRLCIDDERNVASAELDGQPVDRKRYAVDIEAMRTRIVPPQLAGAFTREDVSVPAGHFLQTLRVADTWLHPDVPLGAAVEVSGISGRSDVLVGYGDHLVKVEHAEPRSAGRMLPRNFFVAAGVGLARSSGTALVDSDSGPVYAAVAGIHFTRTLDLIAGTHRLSTDSFTTSVIGPGVRWSPWRTSPSAPVNAEAYLQAFAGYGGVSYAAMTANGVGIVTSAGWLIETGRDWGTTLQVDYLGAEVGGRDHRTGALSLTLALQLEFR